MVRASTSIRSLRAQQPSTEIVVVTMEGNPGVRAACARRRCDRLRAQGHRRRRAPGGGSARCPARALRQPARRRPVRPDASRGSAGARRPRATTRPERKLTDPRPGARAPVARAHDGAIRLGLDRRRSRRPGTRAHACPPRPKPDLGPSGRNPSPSSRTSTVTPSGDARTATRALRALRVLDDVRQRLLDQAVDGRLELGRARSPAAAGRAARAR